MQLMKEPLGGRITPQIPHIQIQIGRAEGPHLLHHVNVHQLLALARCNKLLIHTHAIAALEVAEEFAECLGGLFDGDVGAPDETLGPVGDVRGRASGVGRSVGEGVGSFAGAADGETLLVDVEETAARGCAGDVGELEITTAGASGGAANLVGVSVCTK